MDEAGLEYLSDNHVMRYLKSFNWSIPEAIIKLTTTEKWRIENSCFDVQVSLILKELAVKCV